MSLDPRAGLTDIAIFQFTKVAVGMAAAVVVPVSVMEMQAQELMTIAAGPCLIGAPLSLGARPY